MSHLSRIGLIASLFTLVLSAQTAKRPGTAIPRAADGHPDLQGIWTNATLTPMERPASFAGKLTVSDEEAAVFEKKQQDEVAAGDGKSDSDFHRRACSERPGAITLCSSIADRSWPAWMEPSAPRW